jgi:excisionase family DNA binding protein
VRGQWLPLWEMARLLKVRREQVLEWIEEGEIRAARE